MFIRKSGLITALLTVLMSITPKWVQAAENGLSVTSYQPSGMGFVGRGHCQWWAASPLSNQNPHIWAGFFILFVVGATFVFWRYTRSKKALNDDNNKFEKLLSELEAREKRIRNKILDLDQRLVKDEVGQAEYDELCQKYKNQLAHVKVKIGEIKELQDN